MKKLLLLLVITVSVLSAGAQVNIPDTINANPVTELQTIQTPLNTWITALMVSNTTEVFRSTDNGFTWSSVFSYGPDADFNSTPDPILAVDSMGAVYLIAMRHLPNGGGFIAHLWMWKSVDDGLTWELVSTPFAGNAFADYPSITALGDGRVYLSYTHYDWDSSYVRFNRSFDGGVTWTDTSTFGTLPGPGWTAVGSDLSWGPGNKLCLSYGDYNHNVIYFTSSADSGTTWAPVQNITIAPPSYFNVTKVISSKDHDHIGIIAHQPHVVTEIYWLYSLDGGSNWQWQTVANNAAYGEGIFDPAGNVHLIFNRSSPSPRLCYRYSTDEGQTFSSVITLLTWTSVSLTAGEYQSLLLGNDGLFHLTYVDWNGGGSAKHLIFAPLATDIYLIDPATHAPRIYPNPVSDFLTLQSDATNQGAAFDIIDPEGKEVLKGTITFPETSVKVSSLAPGLYLLRVFKGDVIYVQKMVKK